MDKKIVLNGFFDQSQEDQPFLTKTNENSK